MICNFYFLIFKGPIPMPKKVITALTSLNIKNNKLEGKCF